MPISKYTRGIIDPAVKGMGGTLLAAIAGPALSLSSGSMSSLTPLVVSTGKSLVAGSFGERATAVGIDITSQTIVNAATGSDFNLASTASAALMPKAYFTQGFIAGAVEMNVTDRENGGVQIEPDFSLNKGLVGGVFGKAGGAMGDGIGKSLNHTSLLKDYLLGQQLVI